MTKATIGTISHATLRTEDLLKAFADEYERLGGSRPNPIREELIREARTVDVDQDLELASDVLDALFDALNELAPPYCYFGATEGNSSDFGFWPDMDRLENAAIDGEIIRCDSLTDDSQPGEYMIVNDHGNITVGVLLKTGDFSEYWSCV